MKEKEFKLILDREKHEADVRQHFSKHVELLIDLANYGSNLIPRAYDSSGKKLEDIVVIGILLKQVVSMIDAVEVLISKGAVGPAMLQARAAFEASLYIDWILKWEPEKKAKYYYVSNLRNQRLWVLRFKTGTQERGLELPPLERFDLPMKMHGIVGAHCPQVHLQRFHSGMPHNFLKMPKGTTSL
jgi:hypothetical protein